MGKPKQYLLKCEREGCEWTTTRDSLLGAQSSLRMHVMRKHAKHGPQTGDSPKKRAYRRKMVVPSNSVQVVFVSCPKCGFDLHTAQMKAMVAVNAVI